MKISLDNCIHCNGAGKESDGHYACPDCEGTGYKHGKAAEQYVEHKLDIAFHWHGLMQEILVESFGFTDVKFIPKDADTFLMKYFASEEPAPGKEELRVRMLDELGHTFFHSFRPFCYGHVLSGNRILIYLSLQEAPERIEDEQVFLNQPYGVNLDFYVDSSNYDRFLRYVQPTKVDKTVIQFPKSIWKDLPGDIELQTNMPFFMG